MKTEDNMISVIVWAVLIIMLVFALDLPKTIWAFRHRKEIHSQGGLDCGGNDNGGSNGDSYGD